MSSGPVLSQLVFNPQAPARGEGAPSLAVASPRGGGGGKGKVGPRARSLFIRYGRFCLEKPLPAEWVQMQGLALGGML